jgi:hypothetical protein
MDNGFADMKITKYAHLALLLPPSNLASHLDTRNTSSASAQSSLRHLPYRSTTYQETTTSALGTVVTHQHLRGLAIELRSVHLPNM